MDKKYKHFLKILVSLLFELLACEKVQKKDPKTFCQSLILQKLFPPPGGGGGGDIGGGGGGCIVFCDYND